MSGLLKHYSARKTAFLCCDLQTGFAPRIAKFPQLVFVANRFAKLHAILPEQTKYIVTEQYPSALGKTVPEIQIPSAALVQDKKKFSMLTSPVVASLADVQQVVVFGIECHVCVLQTVADLLESPNIERVAVARDGVASQKSLDEECAIRLFETWGPKCYVSTSESIMFQLMRDASDAKFKAMSALAKEQPPVVN